MGLSHGKVVSVFQILFGITPTRGAERFQIDLRAATRLEPDYQLIHGEVRASKWRLGEPVCNSGRVICFSSVPPGSQTVTFPFA